MPRRSSITPESLVNQFRISEPDISPGGTRVAYAVTPIARPEDDAVSEIWTGDFNGSNQRRFTSGSGEDKSPRWSPDGAWLAFTSDRRKHGVGQLYVMSAHGGEARPLTERSATVSDPRWSPDGRFIAFLAKDEPDEAEERRKKERRDEIVVDGQFKFSRLYLLDVSSEEVVQLSPQGAVNVWSFCWSPDGSHLAAITTPSPRLADYRTPNVLRLIDREGGEHSLLTFPTGMSQPKWSPDGTFIAFLATGGKVVAQDQIHLATVETGQWSLLTKDFEGSVTTFEWLPRGRRIVFSALENLHGTLREISTPIGKTKYLLPESVRNLGTFGPDLSLDRDGKRLVLVRSDSSHPAELYSGLLGAQLQPITEVNKDLAANALRPAEVRAWKGTDGLELLGFLTLPNPLGTKPYPLVLTVHGGPASAFSDRFMGNWHDWTQLLAAAGYAVFMPNPRGSTGRGPAFTDANIGDLGGMELGDILAGVDMLVQHGVADPSRLAIAGWSHGGYMSAWAVTQTDKFKAAIMGAGISDMISDQGTNDIPGFNLDYFYADYRALYEDPSRLWDRSPLKYVNAVTTPTLILHGEKDDRVAASQGREFYAALKSLAVPTELVIYPREPHGFRERAHQLDVMNRILDWLRRYL